MCLVFAMSLQCSCCPMWHSWLLSSLGDQDMTQRPTSHGFLLKVRDFAAIALVVQCILTQSYMTVTRKDTFTFQTIYGEPPSNASEEAWNSLMPCMSLPLFAILDD